jgi:hypothetical protein
LNQIKDFFKLLKEEKKKQISNTLSNDFKNLNQNILKQAQGHEDENEEVSLVIE